MESLKKYLKKIGVLYIPSYNGEYITIMERDAEKIAPHVAKYYPQYTVDKDKIYPDIVIIHP